MISQMQIDRRQEMAKTNRLLVFWIFQWISHQCAWKLHARLQLVYPDRICWTQFRNVNVIHCMRLHQSRHAHQISHSNWSSPSPEQQIPHSIVNFCFLIAMWRKLKFSTFCYRYSEHGVEVINDNVPIFHVSTSILYTFRWIQWRSIQWWIWY